MSEITQASAGRSVPRWAGASVVGRLLAMISFRARDVIGE